MTAAVTPAPPRRRRGTELFMLAFAVLVALAAYAAVSVASQGALPAELARLGAGLAGLVLLAHLLVRWLAPYADPLLLPAVTLFNGLGLVLINRLDPVVPGEPLAPTQLLWSAVGVAGFAAVLLVIRDHRKLQRYTYTAGFLGIVLLLLPLVPGLGVEINGARIWIRAAGFSFQPGELAKLALMVFFAGYLVAKRDVLALASKRVLGLDLPRGRDLGPVLLAWVASLAVLVFERDLGTSLLFFGVFVMMIYVATERLSWLLIGVGLFAGGAYVAYQLFGHVRQRVAIWLDPFEDPSGDGYQIVQSLYGLANGGILGTGLGQGRPESLNIFASTDFIATTVGEELGLTGLMAVLVLYGIVVERGLRAAIGVRDAFGKLLAAGLSFVFALQVFVVVGGVTKLIPLTGLTTPFLAYGGSSLVANWMLVALLLRISDAARRPAPVARTVSDQAQTQVVRR